MTRRDDGAGYGWSPLDESDMPLMQEREEPPMEPLPDNSAVGRVLGYGALGVCILLAVALLASALEPAIK